MPSTRELVLASTSRYRLELLARLGLPFETERPDVDEAQLPGEAPATTAVRLAMAKAAAVAARRPGALVIGSDQVASLGSERLDKPGSHENARRQLAALSGRTAHFDTAVALHDARSGRVATRLVPCEVEFRVLEANLIERYLKREQPYDCAGSAKSEGLGIALIRSMRTEDPTALIGLPLIALTELLEEAGCPVLG
jgi:septum formation protein